VTRADGGVAVRCARGDVRGFMFYLIRASAGARGGRARGLGAWMGRRAAARSASGVFFFVDLLGSWSSSSCRAMCACVCTDGCVF
jgi:hypothetical protein